MWELAGPRFVAGYAGALAVLVIIAIVLRRTSARTRALADQDPPSHIAVLAAGGRRAVFTSLVALRAAGVVTVGRRQKLAVTGPTPAGLTGLDRAVYQAARAGTRVELLPADPAVRLALDEVRDGLVAAGYLPGRDQIVRARLGGLLLVLLAAVGVWQVAVGLAANKGVLFLALLVVLTIVFASRLLARPGPTPTGRRALQRARASRRPGPARPTPARSAPGHPDGSPPAADVAMEVALFGTGAVIAADPDFAADAGLTTGSIEVARRQAAEDPEPDR